MNNIFTIILNFIDKNVLERTDQKKAYIHATYIVQFFYISLLYLMITSLSQWQNLLKVKNFTRLWPVWWLSYFSPFYGVNTIFILFLLGVITAAVFSQSKIARIIAFLGFFQYIALVNSFGKINHGLHLFLFVSFIFIFLPTGLITTKNSNSLYEKNYLLIFFFAQGIVLLAYTMAGMDKTLTGITQFFSHQVSIFDPNVLSYQIAATLLQNNAVTLLGAWMINQQWLGWPLYSLATYLETFSIIVLFRPSIQKFWALGLISMHISIYLTLGIPFWQNVLLIGLLFLYSPFYTSQSFKKTLFAFPLFGFILEKYFY